MKKVYTSPDRLIVSHFQNILESYHISCLVKNEYLAGAAGELPPTECWPELWVTKASQYDEAIEILRQSLSFEGPANYPEWRCTRCGEKLEGQFTACWRCGESRYR